MKTVINDQWSFVKLPAGSSYQDASDAAFEPVDIPHDWLIWQEKDLYETADAWYRRTILLPEDHEPTVIIRFDGVYMDCDILLNGEVIFTHPYGYTAFDVPVSALLNAGQNELMVHIRHRSPNSRWYSGSGIYRDVWLITLPDNHLKPDSLYVTSAQTNGKWCIDVSAEAEEGGSGYLPFECAVFDCEGKEMARTEGEREGNTFRARLPVTDAHTWSPDTPYLYSIKIKYGGQSEMLKTGLRSVLMDPDHGLFLNGVPTKLKGVCLHHDLGALGAAFHPKAARRQIELMQKMGANAIRTSHNPPASAFLDLCDEMGMLVVDEAFDMWERPKTEYDYARFFPQWHSEDVASWIRRDRSHPCVIMWSIGNEIYDMHADFRGTEITQSLSELVRKHDPLGHATVTFGCNYMPWEGGQRCAEYVDAVGYNYGEKYYDQHHLLHPSWIIYGSETGSVLSSRGIYHFPMSQSIMSEADQQCSALGNSNTSWGAENLCKIIIDDIHNPYSLGQFIWSGIDYIGEPTPYHTRSCYFGQADTACFPKDSYYLFKSFWRNEKLIHIGVSWDWNQGQLIDIPVMTNCFEAELFLNGKSLGRIRPDYDDYRKSLPVWHIPYRAGELSARGYDENGNLLCEDTKYTPEETDHFRLTAEDPYLLSDGQDLVFVHVEAADRFDHLVENARDRVLITVSGGGVLLGTDNGDSADPDGYKRRCRRLFSGKLLLIIGSNGKQEDVCITIESKLSGVTQMFIPVQAAEKQNGYSRIQKVTEGQMKHLIPARRVDIEAMDTTKLSADAPACTFQYRILPPEANGAGIKWEITNAAGIRTPFVSLVQDRNTVTVQASGDGQFYLRALCEEDGQCVFISQIEFSADGLGSPCMNPYEYVSAGLYDEHSGDIGTGNEKGIAFARDGESMVGYTSLDFGKTGTDQITADIFALNDDLYEMELWAGKPGERPHFVQILRYQKPSIWNVYQPETWKLTERLTGLQSIFFRMKDKIHLKGFVFELQENAYVRHEAGDADTIYGDTYKREGKCVCEIGNNVTLIWNEMDFGETGKRVLSIEGSTNLPVNTIHIRIKNKNGEEMNSIAEFAGNGKETQQFITEVPGGDCTVSFVFLPGSSFDFRSFRFYPDGCWTE